MVDLVDLKARASLDASGLRVGAEEARRHLNSFGAAVQNTSRNAVGAMSAMREGWLRTAGVFQTVGVGLSLGSLINNFKNFESAMGQVKAITGGTAIELNKAEGAIRKAGLGFRIGANNAASAAQELLKAGVSIQALSTGALDAAIIMAQATGGTYADGATIAAKATQVFRLETEDMTQVVEGAAGVINATSFELADYNLALQQGGSAAKSAGLSLQDFNTLLALTARNLGSSGSDTGTATRTFIGRLTPQSKEAADAMRALGLSFYDAQGKFIGLDETARRLRASFAGLSDEQRNANLITIFGIDAQRMAIALMNEGAQGVSRYRNELNEGARAAEMAAARTQGFAGAISGLIAKWQELSIVLGAGPAGGLMTNATNWISGRIGDFTEGWQILFDPAENRNDPATQAILKRGAQNISEWEKSGKFPKGFKRKERFSDYNEQDRLVAAQMGVSAQQFLNWLDSTGYRQTDNPDWLGYDLGEWAGVAGGNPELGKLSSTPAGRMFAETVRGRIAMQQAARPKGYRSPPPAPIIADPNALGSGFGAAGEGISIPAWPQLDQSKDMIDEYRRMRSDVYDELKRQADSDPLVFDLPVTPEIDYEAAEIFEASREAFEQASYSIRSAWISNDWDYLGEAMQYTWRSFLWDVLIGDDFDVFMQSISKQLASFINWIFDKTGGKNAGGGMFSIIASAASAFAGFFAEGGTVGPGQWGVAGENGPEPVYGGSTGITVFPSSEPGASSGGRGDVNVYVDANDAVLASTLRLEIAEAVGQGVAISRQMAAADMIRKGQRSLS